MCVGAVLGGNQKSPFCFFKWINFMFRILGYLFIFNFHPLSFRQKLFIVDNFISMKEQK